MSLNDIPPREIAARLVEIRETVEASQFRVAEILRRAKETS